MPIYEFECEKCGEKFDLLLGLRHDPQDVRCPKCQSQKARRLMSGFSSASGVRSSGSGCSSTGST